MNITSCRSIIYDILQKSWNIFKVLLFATLLSSVALVHKTAVVSKAKTLKLKVPGCKKIKLWVCK